MPSVAVSNAWCKKEREKDPEECRGVAYGEAAVELDCSLNVVMEELIRI